MIQAIMDRVLKSQKETLAESAWNVTAVNHILRTSDLGEELKIASKVFDDFNITPDDQSIGEFLLSMPVPVAKNALIQFKWIIVDKNTCQYIDSMEKPGAVNDFKLVDNSFAIPNMDGRSVNLGVDLYDIKQAWSMLKDVKIQAGKVEKKPYQHEIIRYNFYKCS